MASLTDSIFQKAIENGASDVHLACDTPLLFRIDGELVAQTKGDVTGDDVEKFIRSVLSEQDFKRLTAEREIDVSYGLPDGTRFRVNCHYERGNLGLVARVIPKDIPTLEEIGLDTIISPFLQLQEGIILFTGPTGTGKSTSLAASLNSINQSSAQSIVTLEDPIEFLFPKGRGVVRQRQFGFDFLSFDEALKRVLRQDPDIVMVGEMRDAETIAAALTLAETGHLILATLHTPNAIQTVDRIIDVFPPHQQQQIRSQLSMSLKAVIAQRLLPKANGGRIAQREVLVNNTAVANIIRDNRMQELKSVLQTGSDAGMIPFEKDAQRLYKEGLISKETLDVAVGEV